MTDQRPLAWQNGVQIPYSDAAVPVWDLGVVAGATVSEMARTYHHQPFRLKKHVTRLWTSCRELGFGLPWSESELADAARSIVEFNTQTLDDCDDLGIVWFVTLGSNPTYLPDTAGSSPTVCVHTFRLPFPQWQDAVRSGVWLTIPEQRHLPPGSFPVGHKVRNRLHWWLADRTAAKMRPGSRALLVDLSDQITETSTACFYAVMEDTVLTAPSQHDLRPRHRTVRATGYPLLQNGSPRRTNQQIPGSIFVVDTVWIVTGSRDRRSSVAGACRLGGPPSADGMDTSDGCRHIRTDPAHPFMLIHVLRSKRGHAAFREH